MIAVTNEERIEILEDVLYKMDEIAQALRRLDDPEIRYRCLADFEGREGGSLGEFVRDILERKRREYQEAAEADGDEEDEADAGRA